MKMLVVIGSLRADGFSRKLGRAVDALAPDGTEVETTDGSALPLYNQDLDGEARPAAVTALLDQVAAADGIVFVTPEYNYGIPGPLKNLVDWASRPAFNSPLKGKPSLVIAHSVAPSGGARAHVQLTSVLAGTLTPTFVAPSVLIPQSFDKFDEEGSLSDEITKARLQATLGEFTAWAEGQGQGQGQA